MKIAWFCFRYSDPRQTGDGPALLLTCFLNICLNFSIGSGVLGCFLGSFQLWKDLLQKYLALSLSRLPQSARGCLRHLMRASASILLGSSPSAPPPASILVFLLDLSFLFSNQQATPPPITPDGSRTMYGSTCIPDACSTCRLVYLWEHHSSGL